MDYGPPLRSIAPAFVSYRAFTRRAGATTRCDWIDYERELAASPHRSAKIGKNKKAEQNEGLVVMQKIKDQSVERLDAWPVKFILDRRSEEVIGWVYEWNTGEQEPMWKNGRREDVIYEHCCNDPALDGRQ